MQSVITTVTCLAIASIRVSSASANYSQQYIGCYGDDYTIRAMHSEKYLGRIIHETCADYCQQLMFTFFGAQHGVYCFCGDQYDRYGTSVACTHPCLGDTTTMCGGDFANSVFWVCPIGEYGPNCTTPCSNHCKDGAPYGTGCYINGTCPSGCQNGWSGETCKTDVNECLSNIGGCGQICNNTAGSFNCHCFTGYKLSTDGKNCQDIDECRINNGGCMHQCNNTEGNHSCSCWPGYTGNNADNSECTDANECLGNNGGCDQICNNTAGSFTCLCSPGYKMNMSAEDKRCEAVAAFDCSTNKWPPGAIAAAVILGAAWLVTFIIAVIVTAILVLKIRDLKSKGQHTGTRQEGSQYYNTVGFDTGNIAAKTGRAPTSDNDNSNYTELARVRTDNADDAYEGLNI